MYICYVDESGDSGALKAGDTTGTPAFVVTALVIDQDHLDKITYEFLQLKRRFFPSNASPSFLDAILDEVKGEKLRKAIRKGGRRARTHAIGMLDNILSILLKYDVKLIAKILVKDVGKSNSDSGIYGSAIMHIARHFQHLLEKSSDVGFIVADSRRKAQNLRVSHTIFTQMFQAKGNAYPNIVEMPLYGHAGNHVMLQLTDIISSAVIFPMVTMTYCLSLNNVNVDKNYTTVRGRYRDLIKGMQYRYQNDDGWWQGGILVKDATSSDRRTSLLFR